MELADLIKLGFNRNEARVYLSLARFGKADARMIIKETKFHKNIVYDNLDKLIDKGLVSFILEGKRRVFQIASSDSLVSFFEEKEKEIIGKKEIAHSIAKEIDKMTKNLKFQQEATIFRGVKGVKSFYETGVRKGENTFGFGAPQSSVDIMGETFWRNLQAKREAKKVKAKLIFNSSIRDYGETIKNNFTEVRYFERNFEPMTETHIQGDEVAIIVWTEEPILFLIHDKKVAESYLNFFEKMWKMAKK